MEELMDAIEDAQYVNAIASVEDGPKPVLPWVKPSDDQLDAWLKKKAIHDLDWCLRSSAIAFYLFSSFVKQTKQDYLRMNFCEEVARFRQYRGRPRIDKAKHVLKFLQTDTETMPKSQIDEYDLERTVPSSQLTKEEHNKLMELNMDFPLCTESIVGLKGPLRKEIFRKFEEWRESERLKPHNESMRITSSSRASNTAAAAAAKRPTHGDETSNCHSEETAPSTTTSSPPKESAGPLSVVKENKAVSSSAHQEELMARIHSLEDIEEDLSRGSLRKGPATATTVRDSYVSEEMTASTGHFQLTALSRRGSGETSTSGAVPGSSGAAADSLHLREMHTTQLRSLTQRLLTSTAQSLDDSFFDQAERVIMESLKRDYWLDFLESPEFAKLKNFMWYADRKVLPDDFFVMRVLGRGGFGLVTACKKGTSGKLYAMKVMNKRRIKMKKSEQLALNERKVLAAVESNFVVNLKYSFQSKDDVFLILDLMTGGDLGFHLHQKGRFPKPECQYYAARIMLGLQALHDKMYVYRDLKPENCLLAEDGRVKISDLGLATKITPTLHGAAGTRGYWAPEMLRRDRKGRRLCYGHTVDWFSFGCCMAEFISGHNPFRSEAAVTFGLERGQQTKEKAIDCATMEMDPDLSSHYFEPDSADLIRRLLDKNEKTRLGYNGCEEIMAHPWFKNLSWEQIISDRKRPPFVPLKDVNAGTRQEIGQFAEDKAYQETVITEADEAFYKDWNWTNPRAFSAEVIEFLIYERETGVPLVPVIQPNSCCCNIL